MPYQPFLIAGYSVGLEKDLEPFLIPDTAFPSLTNAYVWRGRVRRRPGCSSLGRLRRVLTAESLGMSGASPWSFNIFTLLMITGETNHEIQTGSVSITVGAVVFTEPATPDGTLTSVTPGNTGTINYFTGDVVLTHTAGVAASVITFNYYPCLPVMGLRTRDRGENSIDQTIAFDTKYAYIHSGTQFVEYIAGTSWRGADYQFFWSTNYWTDGSGNILFWVTNDKSGVTGDPIRYSNGTTWTDFTPTINNAADKLFTCQMILPFKDRLITLNTWEGANITVARNYPRRLRWSQNGDPTDQTNGWLDTTPGRGGYVDCPTAESIVSCGFYKDRIIVGFQKSTWQIVYTGNEVLPFIWQRINTELGVDSTYSFVNFDEGTVAFGSVGVHFCDGVGVERIDEKIPDVIFNIQNDHNGLQRVYGIRDYTAEVVYWTYPEQTNDPIYPNKVLLYNYVNKTYAQFNDSWTCYGYFLTNSDYTWASLPYASWLDWDDAWNSGATQANYPDVVAGNQQGYVMLLDKGSANQPTLSITAMVPIVGGGTTITSPNHNLLIGQFIQITGAKGSTNLNGGVYKVQDSPAPTADTFTIETTATGTYIADGEITVIPNLNIKSKYFAPNWQQGQQVSLGYIDFLFDRTSEGEVTVNIFSNESNTNSLSDPANTNNSGLLGSNVVRTRPEDNITYQLYQDKIWHRMYVWVTGQDYQLNIVLSEDQMLDTSIAFSNLNLHAVILWQEVAGDLMQ